MREPFQFVRIFIHSLTFVRLDHHFLTQSSAPPPTKHRRQIPHDRVPIIAAVGRAVHLAAGGAEIDAALVERVDGHRVAQDVHVAVFLRQAVGERFPFVAAGLAAVDAQLAFVRVVFASRS